MSAQWTYDAYGQVVDAGEFENGSAPINHCGHKGLFVDRLDAGIANQSWVEQSRLAAGAWSTYYNRNRSYSPRAGRFLQGDPNATGVVVAERATYDGMAATSPPEFSMWRLMADGASLYQYLGSHAWGRTDAMGLYGTPFDTAMLGFSIAQFSNELFSQAAFHQEMDVEWAADFGSADDEYTRLDSDWILQLQLQFLREHVTGSNAIVAGKANRVVDMMEGFKYLVTGGAAELHHIIPKFMGGLKDGALAKMPAGLHRLQKKHLHAIINRVCIGPPMGMSPYARGGGKAIQGWLKSEIISPQMVAEFRRAFFSAMAEFDSKWGTTLSRELRREFVNQRKIRGRVGLFK